MTAMARLILNLPLRKTMVDVRAAAPVSSAKVQNNATATPS
jgi:hypothetical protein